MSREIKFRFWDKEEKRFVDLYRADPRMQQYTGMKDKNDRDIFEGDIIKYHDEDEEEPFLYEVIWGDTGFILKEIDGCSWEDFFYQSYLEVIGNIYENPELLEQQSYKVICDESNNTEEDIKNNQVNADIYIYQELMTGLD